METPSFKGIVLSRTLPTALAQALGSLGELRVRSNETGGVPEGARVYCATAMDAVGAELIDSFPASVGLIANIGVGTDNIDLAAARLRGIAVSNTPVVTEDTADLTLALMLATCRRLSANEAFLRNGGWRGQSPAELLGLRVHGKTLGIVGLGAIGQAVAGRAAGFGMTLLYHGPSRKMDAEAACGASFRDPLGDLLGEADIVSLHCPLSQRTRHLIDAQALARMKAGAVLINTGRGPLVHESALVEALDSGHLGGAGLDVFEFEPEVSQHLLEFPNVTLLPHIGSATGECRRDMATRVVRNIKCFLETGRPADPVE